MKHISRNKKSFLWQALLASTLITVVSGPAYSFTNIAVDTDTGTTPSATGYNITVAGKTLTVNDGDNLTRDPVELISVANNFGAAVVADTTVAFSGSSVVSGFIGDSAPLSPIGNVTLNGAGATVLFQDDLILSTGVTMKQDGTVIFADSVNVTGFVDNTAGASKGKIEFEGTGSISGNIGATNPFQKITINSNFDNSKSVSLLGAIIKADEIFVGDSGVLAQGSTVVFGNPIGQITANITAKTHLLDTVDIVDADQITGNIGDANISFASVKVGQNDDLIVNGDIFAGQTQFQNNNSLILTEGSSITGTVTTTLVNNGTLEFQGTGGVTGQIGTGALPINGISLQGGAGKIVTLGGDVFLDNDIRFEGASTATSVLNLADNVDVSGDIDNQTLGSAGILNFQGSGSVTGGIGGTTPLSAINIQGTNEIVTLSSNIFSDTLNLTGTGNTLNLAAAVTVPNTRFSAENTINYLAPGSGPVTGAIDNISGVAGTGTLNFNNDITVTGLVGATKSLKAINILQAGTDVTFNSNVSANAINLSALNTSAIFSDNVVVTGEIDNTSGVPFTGTANFLGSGKVTGNIGATNNLFSLKINSAGGASETVELNGAIVKAALIDVNDDGATPTTLTLNNAAMALTGNIATTANDLNILNVLNAATITGQIGAAGNEFNLMKVAQNGNTKVTGDIYANNVQFNGNNTLTLADNADINGAVTTTVNNQGILALEGTSKITGTVGAVGFALNAINVLGLNETLTIDKNTFVNNINIANDGEVIIKSNADFTGNINNTSGVDETGKLTFEGAGSVSGNIGAGVNGSLELISVNTSLVAAQTVTLTGSLVKAAEIDVLGPSTTLLLNNPSMNLTTTTGIKSITPNASTLDIKSAARIDSNIGELLNPFLLIKVGELGNTIINGEIFSTTTQFQANNKLSLTDGSDVKGNIDSLNGASLGVLELRGDHIIDGTIGAVNSLGAINVTGIGKTVDFMQSIKANNVNFAPLSTCATTMVFEDNVNITGNIDNTTLTNNRGTLNFLGSSLVTGTIGATNSICKVNLNGVGELVQFQKSVNVGTGNINFNDDLELQIGTAATIANVTANIDNLTGVPNKGTLTFLGSSTMNGVIGSTNPLLVVNLDGPAGKTVNFTQNINAGKLTFTDDGTATLANGITVSGPITTTGNPQGNLEFLGNFTVNNPIGAAGSRLNSITSKNSGTVSVLNNMFATNINVTGGSTISALAPATTFGGNVNVTNGTLAVSSAAQTLTITGDLVVSGGSTLQFDLNTLNPAIPFIQVNQSADIPANSTLKLTNTPQAYFAGNYDIQLVNANQNLLGGIFAPPNVVADSLLLSFEVEALNNPPDLVNQLLLHIDVLPVSVFANRINTTGVAGALDAMAGKDFLGSLQNLLDQLPYFTTKDQLNDALAALAPIVDGSYMQETFSAQLLGYGAVSDRIRYLRQRKIIPTVNNHFDSGIASGDDWDDNGHGRWFKLYGQYSDQDVREQVAGYNAETWGMALGSDVSLNDLNLVGASLNFSHTYVGHDVSDSKSSIYSLQGALYGEQDFCDWFYFNWVTSVAYNKYTTERNFNFGLLPLSPKADFNGWQFGAKGELGYEYLYRGFHVVPNTSLYYSYLGLTGYNESGAGTANQMVDAQHYSMLKGGIGVRTAYNCPYDMGDRRSLIFQPEVRMNFFYDFINDNMQTTSNFTGGGPSFVTNGFTPAPGSFNVGASLSMFSDFSNYVVTMSYDFETKADYTANAGFLRLRYEW